MLNSEAQSPAESSISLIADPDPALNFTADPDPAFLFNADPDPAPLQSNENHANITVV